MFFLSSPPLLHAPLSAHAPPSLPPPLGPALTPPSQNRAPVTPTFFVPAPPPAAVPLPARRLPCSRPHGPICPAPTAHQLQAVAPCPDPLAHERRPVPAWPEDGAICPDAAAHTAIRLPPVVWAGVDPKYTEVNLYKATPQITDGEVDIIVDDELVDEVLRRHLLPANQTIAVLLLRLLVRADDAPSLASMQQLPGLIPGTYRFVGSQARVSESTASPIPDHLDYRVANIPEWIAALRFEHDFIITP